MADGKVLIESKLNTEGVSQGIADLKRDFTKLSRELTKLAQKIESEFNGIEFDDIGEDMADSVEQAADDVRESFDDVADSAQEAASEMEESIGEAAEGIAAESEDAADEVTRDLDRIGDEARETGEEIEGNLSGVFKNIFGANLLSNAVSNAFEKLGEFAMDAAKESIQAAADIQASNAQFEQTFKDVEGTARKSLNNIAKQTGVTASRMQDSYTKIYAFTKSIGGSSTEALDIASRAMIAAADSAAYYDRSLEETTETLQSFLKGNYENDAALGLAATETTRNAKANEMYAKSFIELSEAQKVDVLLAMVEAANEASGALGQAARESDSWTNVMGELNEAWRQFLAVLGTPVLRELTPIIKSITEGLQEMSQVAASTELATGMNEFRDSIAGIDTEFEEASAAIEKNAIMAELYKQRLEELEAAGLTTAASQREYANAVEALNGIYPELNLQIDSNTGKLDDNSRALLGNLNAMKKRALLAAQAEKLNAALNAQADAIVEVQAAEKALANVQTERRALEQQLVEMTGYSTEQLTYLYGNRSLAVHDLTSEELALMDAIVALLNEEKALQVGIEEGNAAISEQDAILEEAKAAYDEASEGLTGVAQAESEVANSADEASAKQEELIQRFLDAKEAARESIDSQIGYFDKLTEKSDMTAQQIVENWQKQQEAFANYAENLQKAMDMGLDETLVKQFADGSQQSMLYLDQLVNGSGVTVEQINAEFLELNQIRDNVAGVIAGIQEDLAVIPEAVGETVDGMVVDAGTRASAGMTEAGNTITTTVLVPLQDSAKTTGDTITEAFETAAKSMKAAWTGMGTWYDTNVITPIKSKMETLSATYAQVNEEMVENTKTAWASMVAVVNESITTMQNKINSLEGKTVTVGVVTQNVPSGASFTGDQIPAYTPDMASLNVPYLARGAVIPPRAPFLAMLGDQSSGTNIEAPLDTIKQAVAEVIGEGFDITTTVNFEGTMAQLIRAMFPEIRSEAKRRGTNLAEEVII